MASTAKLLRHYPGTVTTIEVPMCNGCFGEISFKTIVNALVAKSMTEEESSSALCSSSRPAPTEKRFRSNPYDNIIERLERKYSSHMIIAEGEGTEEDNDEDSNGDDNRRHGNISKRKRRSNPYDAYDFDDPFVDDSDEIAQVTAELKKRKLKTVHGGFFVSSGELEVLKDQEHSRTSNPERLDTDVALSNISSDFILKDIRVPLKLKLVKSKGGQSSKDTQNSASSSLKSPLSEGSTSVRIRSIKTKPLWTPSLASLAALEKFKQAFLNMNVTMGKSGVVPSQLEPLLFSLDRTVRSCQGDSLHCTTGYLEAVVDILGGGLPVAKIRRVLIKLKAKELSQESETLKNSIVHQLIVLIPSSTVLYEPVVRTAPAVDQGNAVTEEKKKGKEAGEGQVRSTSYQPLSTATQIHASLSCEPSMPACAESEATAADKTAPPAVPSQPLSPVKPSVVYKWQVRWPLGMKSLLTDLDTAVVRWVTAENAHRLCLTAFEKKSMEESELKEIIEKDAMGAELRRLLTAYPPSCIHADVSSLRKMIAVERQRVKKNIAKLQLKKCEVLDSSSAGAGAKISGEEKAKNRTESTGSSSISPQKSLANSASSSSSSSSSYSSSSFSSSSLAPATQSMRSSSLMMKKKKSPSTSASIKSLTKPGLPSKKTLQSNASKSIVRKKSKKPCKLTKKAKSILATKRRFSLAPREDKKMKKIKPLRANITTPGGAATEGKDGVASELCPEEKEKESALSKECSVAPLPLPPAVVVVAAAAAAAREVTVAVTAVTGAESMRADYNPAAAAAQHTHSLTITKTAIKAKQVKRKNAPGRTIMTGTTMKKVAAIMAVRSSETIRSAQSPAPPSALLTGTITMKTLSTVKVKATPPPVPTSAHVPPTSDASPLLATPPLSVLVSSYSISAPALPLSLPVPPVPTLALSRPLELLLSLPALPYPVSKSLHVSTPPLPVSIPLRPISTLPSETAGSHLSLSHSTALLLPIHKTSILLEKQKRVRKPAKIEAAVPPSVQAYVLPGTLGIRKSPLQKVERPADSTLQTGKPTGNLPPPSECISALNSYFAGSGSGSSGVGGTSIKNSGSESDVQIILNTKNEKGKMLLKGATHSKLLLSDQNKECVSKKEITDGIDDVEMMQCAVRERDRTPDTAHEDKGASNDEDGGDGVLRASECSPPCDLNSCAVDLTDDETPEKGRYFDTPPQFLASDFPRS